MIPKAAVHAAKATMHLTRQPAQFTVQPALLSIVTDNWSSASRRGSNRENFPNLLDRVLRSGLDRAA